MDEEKFHDRGYKSLFSHPRMVEELIRSFVKEEFVQDIDFSTLTRTFNSFVTEEFREREADIIWQVSIKGRPIYFYLLIEFQSTVDRFMVLRLLSYLLLFYLELIKDEKVRNADRLPAIFPILLYSGTEKWTAAQSIEELISDASRVPSAFIPSFRYYKIAENEFAKESLVKLNNIVSLLFLIERANVKELGEIVSDAIDVLKKEVDEELQRSFGRWLRKLFEKKKIAIHIDIETMTGQEVRTMLEANIERYEEELLARGREEGKGLAASEYARKMKAQGVDREIIINVTGIDPDTLK
jgi:predicted transposase/invertase (TIGR01784 family)